MIRPMKHCGKLPWKWQWSSDQETSIFNHRNGWGNWLFCTSIAPQSKGPKSQGKSHPVWNLNLVELARNCLYVSPTCSQAGIRASALKWVPFTSPARSLPPTLKMFKTSQKVSQLSRSPFLAVFLNSIFHTYSLLELRHFGKNKMVALLIRLNFYQVFIVLSCYLQAVLSQVWSYDLMQESMCFCHLSVCNSISVDYCSIFIGPESDHFLPLSVTHCTMLL